MRIINDIEIFKDLLEIEPNKGYPFVSCDEMALLSVMKYYDINPLSMMVKMNFVYRYFEDDPSEVFSCITPDLYSDKVFFDLVGIEEKSISVDEDSLSSIKKCIDNRHPVLFDIDLFYQEGRELYYKAQHAAHTLIGYGYDDEKQLLYVIDNINGYDKYEIKYSDYHILRGTEKNGDIVEYINFKDQDTYANEFENRMVEIFVSGIKDQYVLRKKSLDDIFLLSDKFADSLRRQAFANNINSVIYKKVSELYRMTVLRRHQLYSEQGQEIIEQLLKNIIAKWKRIFLFIQYYSVSLYENQDYSKALKCLSDVYESEKELCDRLINDLKTK